MEDRIIRHPGYSIRRMYLKSDLALNELANLLDMDKNDLNEIIHQRKDLSVKDCIRLAHLFGSSVEYWIELQKEYDQYVMNKEI